MGTVLVSTRGFKNELCHSRSVLVSAHCFKLPHPGDEANGMCPSKEAKKAHAERI